MLALLTLPYASKTGSSALDRPVSYLALTAVGAVGLVLEAATLVNQGHFGLPDSALGLWISAAGLRLPAGGSASCSAETGATRSPLRRSVARQRPRQASGGYSISSTRIRLRTWTTPLTSLATARICSSSSRSSTIPEIRTIAPALSTWRSSMYWLASASARSAS